jgi:hypothetical protein
VILFSLVRERGASRVLGGGGEAGDRPGRFTRKEASVAGVT